MPRALEILIAIEEERKRIARDIHDGPAQSLANVVLRLEICEKLLDENPQKGKVELENLKKLVKDSLKGMRQLIFDLRPMTLDDLGLIPAIKRFLKDFESHFQISTNLLISGEEKRLNQKTETGLFRIIQEALNNVAKHSQARKVRVTIAINQRYVIINITDDGKGFEVDKVLSRECSSESLGLPGMRERAELLGGKLTVKSSPGKGASITVNVPLEIKE